MAEDQNHRARRRFLKTVGGVAGLGLAGCSAPSGDGGGTDSHRVEMRTEGSDYLFDPIGLFVEPGETVEFVNVSGAHSSTAYHPDNDEHDPRIPEDADP